MQPDQSDIDRQYLKAMEIDLWLTRDADELPSGDTHAAVANTALPIRQWSAEQLQQSLGQLQVDSGADGQFELLVVTEGAAASDKCTELMCSMFSAIKVAANQWTQAGTAEGGSQSLASLINTVNPQAVVLMIRSEGNSLDALRGMQHRLQGVTPFVITTFHPQDLLDNPEIKRPAWEDLKQLRQWLG